MPSWKQVQLTRSINFSNSVYVKNSSITQVAGRYYYAGGTNYLSSPYYLNSYDSSPTTLIAGNSFGQVIKAPWDGHIEYYDVTLYQGTHSSGVSDPVWKPYIYKYPESSAHSSGTLLCALESMTLTWRDYVTEGDLDSLVFGNPLGYSAATFSKGDIIKPMMKFSSGTASLVVGTYSIGLRET